MQTVTSAYVSEFNRDVNTKVNEHTGYDFGELVYVDYEGMDENPSTLIRQQVPQSVLQRWMRLE